MRFPPPFISVPSQMDVDTLSTRAIGGDRRLCENATPGSPLGTFSRAPFAIVEFARVQEASQFWSGYLKILEVGADSGFYRGLVKLQGICLSTGNKGYSVLRVRSSRVYTRHNHSVYPSGIGEGDAL